MKRHITCPTCQVVWVHHEYPPGSWTDFSDKGKRCNGCRNLSGMVDVIHGHLMDGNTHKAEETAAWVREVWPDGYRRRTAA